MRKYTDSEKWKERKIYNTKEQILMHFLFIHSSVIVVESFVERDNGKVVFFFFYPGREFSVSTCKCKREGKYQEKKREEKYQTLLRVYLYGFYLDDFLFYL